MAFFLDFTIIQPEGKYNPGFPDTRELTFFFRPATITSVGISGLWILSVWATIMGISAGTPGQDRRPDFTAQLPEKINGWQRAGEAEFYRPDNLYEYINGGAELFLSYGFQGAAAYEYRQEGGIEIKVDIFDMGDPHDAFGVFWHGCEDLDAFVDPGIQSQYSGGLLTFWKGSYYVSILAYPETPEKRTVVRELARTIAGAIVQDSPIPPIIQWLPRRHLVMNSYRYFTHHVWLNSQYFISGENILGIDRKTPAALARYRFSDDPGSAALLLLVYYPDAGRAESARRDFLEKFDLVSNEPAQTRDHRWVASRIRGRLLAMVLQAPDPASATVLLDRVRIKNYPKKERP